MCQDCQDILEKKAKKGVKSGYYGMCQDLCQDIRSFPVGEKIILLISKIVPIVLAILRTQENIKPNQ